MAGGSIFVAPWADRLGRRPVILACLALAGAGMLLSSITESATQLGALRMLTGVGIGGVLATSSAGRPGIGIGDRMVVQGPDGLR
jgi:MFS family permease